MAPLQATPPMTSLPPPRLHLLRVPPPSNSTTVWVSTWASGAFKIQTIAQPVLLVTDASAYRCPCDPWIRRGLWDIALLSQSALTSV